MKRIATLLVVGVVLMLPAASFAAGSSTCQAYNAQQSCGATGTTTSGTLPFTGLDVVLLLAGGGTLLAAGFVVRRVSRRLG